MLGAIVNDVHLNFAKNAGTTLAIEVAIVLEAQVMKGYLLVLFKQEGFFGA